jgi:type II secretion system protein N
MSIKAGKVLVRSGTGDFMDLGTAVARPGLIGLLTGKQSADVHLVNPWLETDFTVVSSGESRTLDVRSASIDLSSLPEDMITYPVTLEGLLEASLAVGLTGTPRAVLSGDVSVGSEDIEIGGDLLQTLGVAPLSISRFLATGTIRDNVLTLGENAVEGDLGAVARGTVRIDPANYLASRLDLTVEITTDPRVRDRLVPLFSLLGARARADGSIILRVRGAVGRPSVTM